MEQSSQTQLEYDGQCAFAVSTGKTNVKGGNHFTTVNGKRYVFSNIVSKLLFKILPNRIEKADEVWTKK